MMSPKEIADYFNAINRELYGNSPVSNVFNGGNAGMLLIADAINNLANKLEKVAIAVENIQIVIPDKSKE